MLVRFSFWFSWFSGSSCGKGNAKRIQQRITSPLEYVLNLMMLRETTSREVRLQPRSIPSDTAGAG
ncbi:hypothetical protein LZ31DRAFT_67147 [Colletotrichum somersetense]|nr:hypothetical protein LZ31DRAFT_67147 [Colletotrichum somersetense]